MSNCHHSEKRESFPVETVITRTHTAVWWLWHGLNRLWYPKSSSALLYHKKSGLSTDINRVFLEEKQSYSKDGGPRNYGWIAGLIIKVGSDTSKRMQFTPPSFSAQLPSKSQPKHWALPRDGHRHNTRNSHLAPSNNAAVERKAWSSYCVVRPEATVSQAGELLSHHWTDPSK